MPSLDQLVALYADMESRIAELEDVFQAQGEQGIEGVQGAEGRLVRASGEVGSEIPAPSVSMNFTDSSWENLFSFPGVSPLGSIEVLPTGGLRFTKALAGRVDFIYTGYRDSKGLSTFLCGRQKLSMNNANQGRNWGLYYKYIAANKWLLWRETLIAAGKNVNWKLALKSPEHENPNEQELECGLATEGGEPVGAGRIWMLTFLSLGAFVSSMWKQNPDLPAAAGRNAHASQQNTGYGNGGGGGSETDSSSATSNPYTGLYRGDPGFSVTSPQAGDTIFEWEVDPLILASAF